MAVLCRRGQTDKVFGELQPRFKCRHADRLLITIFYKMNQKTTVVLLLTALLAVSALLYSQQPHPEDAFQQWKQQFGVSYLPAEDHYRSIIFLRNIELIQAHNADKTQSYTMGVNQFTGLTDQEFESTYLLPRRVEHTSESQEEAVAFNGEVDWTTQGKVSPIKNQGSCGSCWAFSATGVLESWALFNGKTVSLSEQQLVDCSKKYGNEGCNGGFNYEGLAYVKDHGIATEAAYPYTAKTGKNCNIDGGDFKISSVVIVKGCEALAKAILSHPVGVSADATNWSRYSSGVFSNCKKDLNHDIMLVGMTSEYYKIKNSWSSSWGEKGYIRLALGDTCGICDDKSPWVQ